MALWDVYRYRGDYPGKPVAWLRIEGPNNTQWVEERAKATCLPEDEARQIASDWTDYLEGKGYGQKAAARHRPGT